MWLARRLALVYDPPVIRSSKRVFGAGALALLVVLILAAPAVAAPMDSANEPAVVETVGVRAGDCAELKGKEEAFCKKEFEVALAYSVICPDEAGVALSVTFRVGSDLTLEPLETIARKLKEPCKGTWESTSTTEGAFYVATFEGFPPIGEGDESPASIWISPLGSPTPGEYPIVYEYPFVYEVKEPDGAVIAQAAYTAEVLPERRVEEGETGYQSECVQGGSVRYTTEGKGYCTLTSEVRYRKGWPAPPVTPANTVPPVLSGTAAVDETLTCTNGSWANKPTRVAYRWLRDGVPIAEASSNTYFVWPEDEGDTLTCEVTVSNAAGSAIATSNGLAIPGPPSPGKRRQEEEASKRLTPTIAWHIPKKRMVGGSGALSVRSSSYVGVELSSVTPAVCKLAPITNGERRAGVSLAKVHFRKVGKCTIIARLKKTADYEAAEARRSFRVLARPKVLNCREKPQTRPKGLFVLSCADGNALLKDTRWTAWGPKEAKGSTTFGLNLCKPYCAASPISYFPHSSVRFYDVKKTKKGLLFTRAKIFYEIKGKREGFTAQLLG